MEAACEGEFALVDARNVLDLVGDLVPLALGFFWRCMLRRLDRVSFDHKRIQIDHFGVRVKRVEDRFPAYAGR